jgi:alkylation response protein AidB-like acyl-CoA dehydrogenase
VDFRLSEEQRCLQQRCLELAARFATRSAWHDRDASHPSKITSAFATKVSRLTVARKWGGAGASFLDHTIAYEALGQASTALAFNMHASVVMPLLESVEVTTRPSGIARMVVQDRCLIANFSEPVTTALIGERPLKTRARRIDGGYSVTGRKMFASMPKRRITCW